MTEVPSEPTPEDVAKWEAAVEQIRAEHPDWTDEHIATGLAWAVMTPEVQQAIEEIAAQHALDVELWTSVIRDLQDRFPEWTEQECNDNLIALLRWSEAEALPSALTQRIPDKPRFGPR